MKPYGGERNDAILVQVARILSGFVTLPEGEGIVAETALLEGGLGLDSITLLEVLLAIEEALGCTIPAEDLTPESVATLGSLTALVARKAAAADA